MATPAAAPAAAVSPPVAGATPSAAAPSAATLCGHGPIEPDPHTVSGLPAAVDTEVSRTIEGLTSALMRGDERQQAQALLLRLWTRYHATLRSAKVQAEPASAFARAREASAAERSALARLAQTTRDPAVYRLAFLVCVNDPGAHCAQLSAAQWARLDPSDGLPWMYGLAAAQAAGDDAGRAEAVYRLSLATRMSNATVPLALLTDHPQIATQPMPVQVGATLAIIQARLALPMVDPRPLLAYCAPAAAAPRDPLRVQQCGAAGRVLVDHADDRISRQVGLRLGTASGWPADEVQRLGDQLDAEMWVAMQQPVLAPGTSELACEGFAQLRNAELQRAREGELAVLHRQIKASEVPVAELARRYREAAQAQRAAAAQRDAAASGSGPAAPGSSAPR